MTYAKLINNSPSYAPNPILHAGFWYGNPPGSVYEAEGYKVVIYTDPPGEADEGYQWQEVWTETANSILQGWEQIKEEVPEDNISAEEIIDILFGGEV